MSLTAFNRMRRVAAEQALQKEQVAVEVASTEPTIASTEELTEPVQQVEAIAPVTPTTSTKTAEQRRAEIDVMPWQQQLALLKEYGLPVAKPKDQNWDAYAIPLILQHEGF